MSVYTWCNYSSKLWHEWGLWFRLAVPGLFMVTLEWTIFEIGSLVAGVLGERELAAQTIIYNIESMCYTLLPLGVGLAASIRVGHFLGAQSAVGPKSVTSVSVITICLSSVPLIILFIFARWKIPYLFTSDSRVVELAANLLPILAVFQIFDSIVGTCSGVIRGAGLQYIGAIICIVTLYVIGAPVGICLIFLAKIGLQGLWWGLCLGVFISSIIYLIVCFRLNWEKQVASAMARIRTVRFSSRTNYSRPEDLDSGEQSTEQRNVNSLAVVPKNLFGRRKEEQNSSSPPSRKRLLCSRILLVAVLTSHFIISLILYCQLRWKDYFGVYCLYDNGTFIQFNDLQELNKFRDTSPLYSNCTTVIP
ncbi:unnamed protein product [Calicophoron daubneyi]